MVLLIIMGWITIKFSLTRDLKPKGFTKGKPMLTDINFIASLKEQETIIRFDSEAKRWNIYTDVPRHARKYAKLIPDDQITQKGYRNNRLVMLEGSIDDSDVVVSLYKKKQYTDEQRRAMAEVARRNF